MKESSRAQLVVFPQGPESGPNGDPPPSYQGAARGEALRILVLNYEYPPLGGGGGSFAAALCAQLVKMGHQVRVLTGYYRGLPRVEVKDGVIIYRPRSWRRHPHTCGVAEMGLFLLTGLFPALRQALTWQPHLVQAHFAVPTGVLSWLIRLLTGVPYVLSTQLGDVPGGVPDQTDHLFKWLKPFTVPIWRAAAQVTVPSRHIRALAHASYPGVPLAVVHNGINLEGHAFSPLAPHQPVRLIFAGRFSSQKNLPFLIQVLQQVQDLGWRLELLGDGPEMPRLREQVNLAGLGGRVHFHGWVAPEQVAAIMSQGDILVLPSLAEGLPLVGIQALAAGLAILGSDIGGIGDVAQSGLNGFLCPVNDSGSFAGALRVMLTTDGLLPKMKAGSRSLAASFAIPNLAAQFQEIFQRVAGRT
jgi:glycosyltransferase involved in cell wall biosynthesis